MIEELFAQGDSFLHRRDPRGKIIAALVFSFTIALLTSFSALLVGLLFSLLLLTSARLPLLPVGRRMLLINGFTLFLWLSLPLTYGGGQTVDLLSLALSREGIVLAAIITLKTNIIVLAIIALLTTSTIAELGSALDRLGFPKKICFILLYSYRYVFVIHQEYQRLLRAAKLRSFSPGTNLHTYKTFAHLFGMTLVKSYNRSQRVHQAMLLRGFNGRLVSLYRYRFNRIDSAFVVLVGFVALLAIFLNLGY
jgi:cobalt/nickel transport system permease protein